MCIKQHQENRSIQPETTMEFVHLPVSPITRVINSNPLNTTVRLADGTEINLVVLVPEMKPPDKWTDEEIRNVAGPLHPPKIPVENTDTSE